MAYRSTRWYVSDLTQDLRNHGASAHADSMTYAEMVADVKRFFDEQSLSDIALIGHSLGGKVVMSMALDPELRKDALSHLVSVDMSPAQGAISPEFMEYARAMLKIDKANVTSRSEADKILEKVEPELSIRQFLLTNLKRSEGEMHFRIPIETMIKSLDDIGRFPYAPGEDGAAPERQWDGPTLFIKGTKSKYVPLLTQVHQQTQHSFVQGVLPAHGARRDVDRALVPGGAAQELYGDRARVYRQDLTTCTWPCTRP